MQTVPHPWPNEIELLLACARREMREPDLARARRAIDAGIDWDRLLRVAAVHRLLPLLSRFLQRDASAPAAVRAAARQRAASVARHALLLAGELAELLRSCAQAGIVAVPLKGPMLAESLYGSIGLRAMDDLDVLIARRDLPRARTVLAARGYVPLPIVDRSDALFLQHHLSFQQPRTEVNLELHHRMLAGGRRGAGTAEWLAPRLVDIEFAGVTARVPADEDLFVYLCQHGAAHSWGRLEWLAGVAELLRSGRVRDWEHVRACAGELGGWRRVTAAILLVRELFEADLAAGVDTGAAENRVIRRNAAVVTRIAREPGRTMLTPRERLDYLLATDRTTLARGHRWWSHVTTLQPADVAFMPLPRAAWPLYYAVRPLRLAARRLARVGRRDDRLRT